MKNIVGLVLLTFLISCAGEEGDGTSGRPLNPFIAMANEVLYDNQQSGLNGQNVQAALDETEERVNAAAVKASNQATTINNLDVAGSCTGNMRVINGLKVCIDPTLRESGFSQNFAKAQNICVTAGLRLCSAYELYAACKQGLLTDALTDASEEWSSTIIYSYLATTMLGTTVCNASGRGDRFDLDNVGNKVRCCH